MVYWTTWRPREMEFKRDGVVVGEVWDKFGGDYEIAASLREA